MDVIKAGDCFVIANSSEELNKFIQNTNGTVIPIEMAEKIGKLVAGDYMYEERIPNGTIVIEKETGKKHKIIDAIETNNQFGYGVYLYCFEDTKTGFGLYESEFTISGSD